MKVTDTLRVRALSKYSDTFLAHRADVTNLAITVIAWQTTLYRHFLGLVETASYIIKSSIVRFFNSKSHRHYPQFDQPQQQNGPELRHPLDVPLGP